jgi:uncharacterized Zn-finger protein
MDKKIRDKLKQLKYQHLKRNYALNLSKLPHNCKYNKEIILPNKSKINICGFDFEENKQIDLCFKPEHARECNAFCSKKSKEEIYIDFVEELKDDQIRATKYKDINILYWMFPNLKDEELNFSKLTFFEKIKSWFKLLF